MEQSIGGDFALVSLRKAKTWEKRHLSAKQWFQTKGQRNVGVVKSKKLNALQWPGAGSG